MQKTERVSLIKHLNHSPIATVTLSGENKQLSYNDAYNKVFDKPINSILEETFGMTPVEAESYIYKPVSESVIQCTYKGNSYYLTKFEGYNNLFSIISLFTDQQLQHAKKNISSVNKYFFMNLPFPCIIFDFNTHKVDVANKALINILGIPLEHMCNMDIIDVFHENSQLISNYLNMDTPYKKSFLVNQYDVTTDKTMIFEIVPVIKDEQNEEVKVLFMMRDIFGEIEVQRERLSSDFLRYQFLTRATSDSILMVTDGIITDVNNAACQLWQYSKFEIINKPLSLLIPDASQYINNTSTVKGHPIQFLGVKKNGTAFNGSLVTQTFDNLNKKSMVYIIRDLTEHNIVEKLMTSNNDFTNIIFNAQPNLIAVYNEKMSITRCNKAMLDFLGYETFENFLENVGDLSNLFLKEEGFITADNKDNWFLLPIENPSQEYAVAMNDSKGVYNIFNIQATMVVNETEVFYVVSLTNITETIEKQRCLKEANSIITSLNDDMKTTIQANMEMLSQYQKLATIGTMIGFITHQWKQPLNTIGLIAQNTEDIITEEDDFDKEDIVSMMQSIMNQVMFMSETMENFKNFFKTEDVNIPFNIVQAINSINQLLSPMMKKHHVAVNFEKDDIVDTTKVFGFQNSLKQVIMNIIVNSRDAILTRLTTEPDIEGCVDIKAYADDNNVHVVISDNGTGLSQESLSRIYEMNYTTKGSNGTGIGMYMSQMIVEKMNGSISIQNKETEKGAVTHITLPRYAES